MIDSCNMFIHNNDERNRLRCSFCFNLLLSPASLLFFSICCFFFHFFPEKKVHLFISWCFDRLSLTTSQREKKTREKKKKTSSLTNSPYGANKEIHFRQCEWHHGSQLDTKLFLFSPTFFLHYHNGAFFLMRWHLMENGNLGRLLHGSEQVQFDFGINDST